MHSRVIALILAAGAVAAAAACGDDTSPATPKPVHFAASLTPQGEVGATIVSNGTGSFTGTLDTVVQTVLTDENADIDALLAQAQSDAQSKLDG